MTVRITFAGRTLLDRLLKAGDQGVSANMNSATARALVLDGYAAWDQNHVIPRLMITEKGKSFYHHV